MSFPVTANLDNDIKVEIHLHRFHLGDRDRQCWTYLTRGLSNPQTGATGQKEMALTLLVDDDGDVEAFPRTPVRMFELLAERLSAGQLVDFGDTTRLGNKGIFGFPTLLYVPAIQFEGLPPLDDYLALILVHEAEYDYARHYGLTRFLARLGRFCSSFPYPTWNTQVRPNLFESSSREVSILEDASHVLIEHSHVHLKDRVLQLQLQPGDLASMVDAVDDLPAGRMAIFNTAFSPRSDASLYWQEGQQEPGAYAAPESATGMISGSFIALGESDVADISILEDGFSVSLPASDWAAFRAALSAGNPLEVALDETHRFVLDILPGPVRPVARPYFSQAVWKKLMPLRLSSTISSGDTPVLTPEPYINLTGEQSLAERVQHQALEDYLRSVYELLVDVMSEETDEFLMILELRIYPGRVQAEVSADIELNPEFIDFIQTLVEDVTPCAVSAQVRLQQPYRVNRKKRTS